MKPRIIHSPDHEGRWNVLLPLKTNQGSCGPSVLSIYAASWPEALETVRAYYHRGLHANDRSLKL